MEQHDVWDALSFVGGTWELMKGEAFGCEEGCLRKMVVSHQNNKFNYYVVVNLLLTWVSLALSKNGAGCIPVIQ